MAEYVHQRLGLTADKMPLEETTSLLLYEIRKLGFPEKYFAKLKMDERIDRGINRYRQIMDKEPTPEEQRFLINTAFLDLLTLLELQKKDGQEWWKKS